MSQVTSRLIIVLVFLIILSTAATTAATSCTYASRAHISQAFGDLVKGNYSAFFSNVVDDVDWNVQGTHPLAGRYTNKTVFFVNAVARLAQVENLNLPENITLLNVVGGCDEEWSVQELREQAVLKNGENFDNTYAWVTRWSTQQEIVQVRAYLDSALVAKVIFENEAPTDSTYHTPRTVLEPGPGGLPNLTAILDSG